MRKLWLSCCRSKINLQRVISPIALYNHDCNPQRDADWSGQSWINAPAKVAWTVGGAKPIQNWHNPLRLGDLLSSGPTQKGIQTDRNQSVTVAPFRKRKSAFLLCQLGISDTRNETNLSSLTLEMFQTVQIFIHERLSRQRQLESDSQSEPAERIPPQRPRSVDSERSRSFVTVQGVP